MKGQRQRRFFKGEHFITKRQIQHLEVVTNLVRICLAMPMSTFIYECRPVDVHVPCFVCMSMSVSFSVSMTACPHLHFVRPGWWGIAGAPVGKNSVHKLRNAGCSKQCASPRPCHADADVQTYVCIPTLQNFARFAKTGRLQPPHP